MTAQPNDVTAAEANRWRRYESVPGGLPARRYLARPPIDRVVRTVEATNVDLALRTTRAKVVLDLAPAARCYCSAESDRIAEMEPERSASPIIVAPPTLDLSPDGSAPRGRQTLRARLDDDQAATPSRATAVPTPPISSEASSRREPFPAPEPPTVSPPEVQTAPAVEAPTVVIRAPEPPAHRPNPARPTLAAAPHITPTRPFANRDAAATGRERRRRAALVALPAAVLAVAVALGTAVYLGAARHATPPRDQDPASDSVVSKSASGEIGAPRPARTPVTPAARPQSAAAAAARDSALRADSARIRARARRVRPAPAPEIVPGWLPQGQPAFVPRDTSIAPNRDSTVPRARPDTTPGT